MDRRQRKSREAIFKAFTELLARKSFHQITVEQIIQHADVGRATFYAHFETKDTLLYELNRELFCHVFDGTEGENHKHIFECDPPESPFLHLLRHLAGNDHQILLLLCSPNHELFRQSFQTELEALIRREYHLVSPGKAPDLPEDFWVHHVAATFVQSVFWWLQRGKVETTDKIFHYFQKAVNIM